MTKSSWYLRLKVTDIANSGILVGDRSRVRLIQNFLSDSAVLNEDRGLLTVTGYYKGQKIVVIAFGMGAPIAGVVAHELIDLGVQKLIRLGTTMPMGRSSLGDFVLADRALARDGTSATYIPNRDEFAANADLNRIAVRALEAKGINPKVGVVASTDGFYTEMMHLDQEDQFGVVKLHNELIAKGCIGLDMETAALFAIGERLSAKVASLCLATVEGTTKAMMDDDSRKAGEVLLAEIGLETVVGE